MIYFQIKNQSVQKGKKIIKLKEEKESKGLVNFINRKSQREY